MDDPTNIDTLLSLFPDSYREVDREYVNYHYHFQTGIFNSDNYVAAPNTPFCISVYATENGYTTEIVSHKDILQKEFESVTEVTSYIETLATLLGSKYLSRTCGYEDPDVFHGYLPETGERIVFKEDGEIITESLTEYEPPIFSNTEFNGDPQDLKAILTIETMIGTIVKYIYQNCILIVQSGAETDPTVSAVPLVKPSAPDELLSDELSENPDGKTLNYASTDVKATLVSEFV